jgi:gamma-glutamylcyclotransferase (GGCT)/AIG2-like uncharacterized protein YtfP
VEIDSKLEGLNKRLSTMGVGIEKLDQQVLSKDEKDFIQQYSPGNILIIYGTLAPGKPNHSKIGHIKGTWAKGFVKGILVNEGWGAALGYFGFKHTDIGKQENIEAYILFSDDLENNWSYLDEFEGAGYKRILAEYQLENGEIGVGNIYAINETIK